MRRLELLAPLDASPDVAFAALTDLDGWSRWGRFASAAEGALVPGSRWRVTLRPGPNGAPREMTPRFVSGGPRSLTFETRIIAGALARIEHRFEVQAHGAGSVLRQTFTFRGALVPLLWGALQRGCVQFEELGADLARELATPRSPRPR